MRARRFGACLVVVAMLMGVDARPAAADVQRFDWLCPRDLASFGAFDDVPATNIHAQGIYCLLVADITTGTTARTYEPSAPVSRAQMATFLRRLLTETTSPAPAAANDHYTDDDGSIHEPAIDALTEADIIPSTGTTTFDLSTPLRRDEMAAWMHGTWQWLSGGAHPTDGTPPFTDTAGSPHAADIGAMWSAGVVAGTSATTYDPSGPVTRAQMGSFLSRLLALHANAGFVSHAYQPAIEDELLALHNAARESAGLPPLTLDMCQRDAGSRPWSLRMADAGRLDHDVPFIQGPGDPCGAASARGENVQLNGGGANEMMAVWMGSQVHRDNILSPLYNRIAVGVFQAGDGTNWVTVRFTRVP